MIELSEAVETLFFFLSSNLQGTICHFSKHTYIEQKICMVPSLEQVFLRIKCYFFFYYTAGLYSYKTVQDSKTLNFLYKKINFIQTIITKLKPTRTWLNTVVYDSSMCITLLKVVHCIFLSV